MYKLVLFVLVLLLAVNSAFVWQSSKKTGESNPTACQDACKAEFHPAESHTALLPGSLMVLQ